MLVSIMARRKGSTPARPTPVNPEYFRARWLRECAALAQAAEASRGVSPAVGNEPARRPSPIRVHGAVNRIVHGIPVSFEHGRQELCVVAFVLDDERSELVGYFFRHR
jgi:hypothetical protein